MSETDYVDQELTKLALALLSIANAMQAIDERVRKLERIASKAS